MYTMLSLSNPPCLFAIWNCLLNISSGFNYPKPIVSWISFIYWFFNTTSSRVNLLCDTNQIVLKLWTWALLHEKHRMMLTTKSLPILLWPSFSYLPCSVVKRHPEGTEFHCSQLVLFRDRFECGEMIGYLVLCLSWSLLFCGTNIKYLY